MRSFGSGHVACDSCESRDRKGRSRLVRTTHMPELPEVETVRRGLEPAMQDAVIAKATVNRPDLRWPFPENMAGRLTGQKILGLRRRSKYILIDLQSGEVIEFVDAEIEALQEKIAEKLGYRLKGHKLELYGVPIKD